jgi:hypothetical protein
MTVLTNKTVHIETILLSKDINSKLMSREITQEEFNKDLAFADFKLNPSCFENQCVEEKLLSKENISKDH